MEAGMIIKLNAFAFQPWLQWQRTPCCFVWAAAEILSLRSNMPWSAGVPALPASLQPSAPAACLCVSPNPKQ